MTRPKFSKITIFQKKKRLRHAGQRENHLKVIFWENDTSKNLKNVNFSEKKRLRHARPEENSFKRHSGTFPTHPSPKTTPKIWFLLENHENRWFSRNLLNKLNLFSNSKPGLVYWNNSKSSCRRIVMCALRHRSRPERSIIQQSKRAACQDHYCRSGASPRPSCASEAATALRHCFSSIFMYFHVFSCILAYFQLISLKIAIFYMEIEPE